MRYGLFASILRQPVASIDAEDDAFHHYYDLLRTIGLSTTEDMIHPTRTWLKQAAASAVRRQLARV